MTPEDKAALEERARRAGTSVGEFVRRSVEAYDPDARSAEIEALLQRLEERRAEALAALASAEDELAETRRTSRRRGGRAVSLTDRILDGLQATIQLNERVTAVAQRVGGLAREVRDLDRRLIRVETALELATGGKLATRRTARPSDPATDDGTP